MVNYEFPPVGGGGGIVTYYLGREFAKRGHDVTLVTSHFDRLARYELVDGIKVYRVPVIRKSPNVAKVHEMLTYIVGALLWSFGHVPSIRPDIVQVFFGIPSGPVAYVIRKMMGHPYVVFLGGRDVPRPNPDPPYYRYLYPMLKPAIKAIWRGAGAIIACSHGLRELALQTDPDAQIEVIPDGIDLSRFHAPRRSPDPEVVRVLSIGRLIPRKGFYHLISSLPMLRGMTGRKFTVEIVGDGPMMEELKGLAEGLKVTDLVLFSGSVPYEKLHERYESADIFALCSSAEGMPLVVLEAMATGLPVVASRVQGIEELVRDGINGYLIDDPSKPQVLADRLSRLIEDSETRLRMGAEALRSVGKYDWSNIAERYLEIYRRVLSRT
jgi:glycosyltransferase involved in cell wall biosynthesis